MELKETTKTNYLGNQVFLGYQDLAGVRYGVVVFHPNPDKEDMDNPECCDNFIFNTELGISIGNTQILKMTNDDFDLPSFEGEYVCKCGFSGTITNGKWIVNNRG